MKRWSDGTWAKLFQPQDLISKVIALLPAPGTNLLRFHGQFAPDARWRSHITRAATVKRGKPPEPPDEEQRQRRMSWAVLLERSFAINALNCPRSGGDFVDVPARHGWKGAAYDNSRYEMVSVYDPDPPQQKHQREQARSHRWRFYWQVPPAWPTGQHRLLVRCRSLGTSAGATVQDVKVASTPFAVQAAAGVTLTADIDGGTLALAMRVPGVPQQQEKATGGALGRWAGAGYRLLDRDAKHQGPALVRADLKVEVAGADGAVFMTLDAPFDASADRAVAKLPGDAPPLPWTLRAWVAADATPAKVEATLAKPCATHVAPQDGDVALR